MNHKAVRPFNKKRGLQCRVFGRLFFEELKLIEPNIGALIIRPGFWGYITYKYIKESPKHYSNYSGPYITCFNVPSLDHMLSSVGRRQLLKEGRVSRPT